MLSQRSIFISYRRSDSQVVTRNIYSALAEYFGHEVVFRDIDSIPAGQNFKTYLETELDHCEVLIVVIGPTWISVRDSPTGKRRLDDPNDWVRLEIEYALKRNILVIPLLIDATLLPPEDQLPGLLKLLRERQTAKLRHNANQQLDSNDLNRLIRDIQRHLETPHQNRLTGVCPYKGLSYFDCNDEDSQYFYGRRELTQTLLTKVRDSNFLAIVGASGSGKSSVLRAGLIQYLKIQGNCEIRILLPGEHPVQNLASAFVDDEVQPLESAEQRQKTEGIIQFGIDGLCDLVKTAKAPRVYLVIDQFEEAFTLCQGKEERTAFFNVLLAALETLSPKLCLIVAMRSDFVGRCFEHHYGGLAQKIESHLTAILPMTQDELTQAIIEPAHKTGLTLEPGLVDSILKDLEQSSSELPLLQYTLTELWKGRHNNQLKLSTYIKLGGVTGTLQKQADEVYASLTPKQQEVAKHIFLNLTQLGEGSEDTRRRVTQASLVSEQYPEPLVAEVIKLLVDATLVVTDDSDEASHGERTATIEVVHEALIRNWPKLRQWLDENRDLLRQKRKIELAAEEWSQHPQKQGKRYLLEGRQLTDARHFQRHYDDELPLSSRAQAYLSQSLSHRRNNRIKLIFAGLVIPLVLASYAGIETLIYFWLKPHWDLIYAYDPENNKVGNISLVRALREINDAGRSLKRISLPNADLRNANLSDAKLTSANLSSANLSNAYFISANLSDANLSDANLSNANLSFTNLSFTDLSNADLSNADLSDINLRYSDLSNADLSNADLSNADLSNADLSNADLSNADLSNTILLAIDLRSTFNLNSQHLIGENKPWLCNVALPDTMKTIDPNRDCETLPELLVERHPWMTLEEAQQQVQVATQKKWN
jgi:hypothetical protein